ncbi:hypothetical protein [Vallicoccus soli]|uniref:Rho termination factor N-terminal domain-containing protein n=1 Tax=Vallicoccus soli TaxID=2339232 RepID=A0A3A3YXL6_9ACTN|nr:hypothetical protein [Vallicoccus soli]RJK93813.1 hypothetical protein D5H78_15955 [Vallicoccus soli]
MARNVISLVATEHRRIDELLVRSVKGRGSREKHRDEAVALVNAHLRALRAEVHDFVLQRVPERSDEVAALDSTQDELVQVADGVAGTDPTTPSYAPRVEALRERFVTYASREGDLLSEAARSVEVPRLRDLGAAYLRKRDAELKARAAGTSRGTPRRLDVPKADLYEQARRAGIPGRSAMSREELIRALREAQGARR